MTRKAMGTALSMALVLAGAGPAQAERPVAPGTFVAQERECDGGPLAVVAQFLVLAPEQVETLAQMIQEREQAVGPIQQHIVAHYQSIEQLIASGGDPAKIGQLLIEVHQLEQQAQMVQAQFLASVRSLLDEAQRQRLAQAQMAAQLQPVVPAFVGLRLF